MAPRLRHFARWFALAVATSAVSLTAFCADGLLVTLDGRRSALLFDALTGAAAGAFTTGRDFGIGAGVAFGPDGNLYLADPTLPGVLRFRGDTGVFQDVFNRAPIPGASALAWTDANLYVPGLPAGPAGSDGAIYRLDRNGVLVNSFSVPGIGLVRNVAVSPAGEVVAGGVNRVLFCSAVTGAVLRTIVLPAGATGPTALALGPEGSTYIGVDKPAPQVLRYLPDGTFRGIFATGPPMNGVAALAWGHDGNLYVGTIDGQVLRYKGDTGAFAGVSVPAFATGGARILAMAFFPSASPTPIPVPTSLKISSGDDQDTFVRSYFPQRLVVEVRDEAGPMAGQNVAFAVAKGPAFLYPDTATTDRRGLASAIIQAGSEPGPVEVRASVGPLAVTFRLLAYVQPGPDDPSLAGNAVTHAARRTPRGLAGSEIAQGSLFTVSGRNLGPSSRVEAAVPYGTRLPDQDSGTSVKVAAEDGSTVDALVVSASATEVTALLPSTTALGKARVTVARGGKTSNPARMTISAGNFGIYTHGAAGTGPAVAFAIDENGAAAPVGLASPARGGQVIALRGTGLGGVAGAEGSPSTARFDTSGMAVWVGGAVAPVLSAGRAAGLPGVDEIRFAMPGGGAVADGCYVPVAVRRGAWLSNFATIAKDPGPTCSHPIGLGPEKLARLDAGESVSVGILGVVNLDVDLGALGSGALIGRGGIFARLDSASLFLPGGIATSTLAKGACTVLAGSLGPNFQNLFPVPLGKGMDAGSNLTAAGPNLGPVAMPRRFSGGYDKTEFGRQSRYPGTGTWTFAGTGGSEIAPFQVSFDVPPGAEWTGASELAILDRTMDATVRWKVDPASALDLVVVSGFAGTAAGGDPVQAQFSCAGDYSAGEMTIPATILAQLPPTGPDDLALVAVTTSAFGGKLRAFDAKTAGGDPLDGSAAGFVTGSAKAVVFR